MVRSATGKGVSVSVAGVGVGSGVPGGLTDVTVLTRLPVALEAMLAVTVKVAVPPLSRLITALMLPLPLAGPLEPAEYTAVHVSLDTCAGIVSLIVTPATSLGPTLVATIV